MRLRSGADTIRKLEISSRRARYGLYPEIESYSSGTIPVGTPHELYWEESGNSNGVPILFLHGGPGAGVTGTNRRFFDPQYYRIILFDQRGAGRSTPLGELLDNTTPHLVEDIEVLRKALGVDRWIVFGGSWGSTLALAYAETYPKRCNGLILRGIFLCRPKEIEWFLYGMRMVFPEQWEVFAGHLPHQERYDLLKNYYRRLIDPNPDVHMPAAVAWSRYEGSCSTLLSDAKIVEEFERKELALGLARIEAHYFTNEIFLPEDALLTNVDRVRSIPGIIVQGRYDMICPFVTAAELHDAWPEAQFVVVPDAGHSSLEPGICSALISATNQMRNSLVIP